MTTKPSGSNTPPMPEPPSMKDRFGNYLPDAIGTERMVRYLADLQNHAKKGWAKAHELEATLHGPLEFMRGEIVGLKAKLEEAEQRIKKLSEMPVAGDRARSILYGEKIDELCAKLEEAERDTKFRISLAEGAVHEVEVQRNRHKAQAAALAEALEQVMGWIENWSPSFTEEQEWHETRSQVERVRATYREGR